MPIGARGRYAPQNTFLETLAKKFDGTISNFVLGNAQSNKDYPIVYCSDGFCDLTGYSRSEVMCRGCACRFLVGIDTDRDAQYKVNKSLHEQTELKVEIQFYKKNGAPFWCLLDLMPIKNELGEVVLFLVSHKDVTKDKLSVSQQSLSGSTDCLGNGFATEAPVPRLRKFSRDILLHIQRQYGAKNSLPNSRSKYPSGSSTVGESSSFIPQYKLENAKLPRFMVLHFGRPRLIWDWVILILVCYIAIMVPFSVAFKTHDHTKELIIADTIVEVFFIIDIIINFRTTYIDKKSGRIITNKKLIAQHYLKGWFIVDFLAALPFEALYFTNHSWGFLVSLLKCGRLLRLFRIARRISRYIEYTAALLGLLMFSFALLGHWFACIWYAIGYEELKNQEQSGWLYGLGDQMGRPYVNNSISTGPSKGDAYISSLYFILTSFTTVGFGNIAPNTAAEKIFSVIVLLLGALMQSAIFGNMTAIIQKLYSVRARFHAKANEIKQFVRLHRIENDLKRRIEDYFLTHWSVSKGVDTDEMLESFPSELRADICLHMFKNFLGMQCFSGTSRGCCRLLSLKVKRVFFGPGELILKEKDAIDAIFFVNSGTIEIVQKECIVAILGSGDLFGEDVSRKLPVGRSNGDVRALTYCDLLYLTRANMLGVLHLYPDFAESFSQKLEMTFNLGARERDLSTCGPLDSITEGDEEGEDERSESTEDDALEEHALLHDARISNPITSPPLPLWQRKIRNMECNQSSASLQERLMRIESDTSDLSASEDNNDNDNDNGGGFGHDKADSIEMDFLRRSNGSRENCDHFSSQELIETTDGGASSLDIDNDACDRHDLMAESSFISTPQCDVSTQSGILTNNHHDKSNCVALDRGSLHSSMALDRGSLHSSMTSNCSSTREFSNDSRIIKPDKQGVDLLEDGEETYVNSLVNQPGLVNKNQRRTSKFTIHPVRLFADSLTERCIEDLDLSNRTTNHIDQRSVVIDHDRDSMHVNGDLLTLSDQTLDKTVSNGSMREMEDMQYSKDNWRGSSDMSWDMMCGSYAGNQPDLLLNGEHEVHNVGTVQSTPGTNLLDLPKHKIERLSSGVFSRLSDSESDLLISSDVRTNIQSPTPNSHDSPTNSTHKGLINSQLPEEEPESLNLNNVYIESYLADFKQDLVESNANGATTDVSQFKKVGDTPVRGNHEDHALFKQLANDVIESKQAIINVNNRMNRIGNDVEDLKKELTLLTSMLRTLFERKESDVRT
eukprot:gene17353-19086_t